MSFISNLFKGFIRSAVNQVGRDGGRIISNNLYNKSYNINSEQIKDDKKQEIINTSNDTLKYIIAFLITYCLPIFGMIMILVYGYYKINKRTKRVLYTEQDSIRVPDKRYKEGYRLKIREKVKSYKESLIPENIMINRKKGKIYMIIGFSYIIVFIIIAIYRKIF